MLCDTEYCWLAGMQSQDKVTIQTINKEISLSAGQRISLPGQAVLLVSDPGERQAE